MIFTRYRYKYRKRRKPSKLGISDRFVVLLLLVSLMAVLMSAYRKFTPILEEIAVGTCTFIANQAINETISEKILADEENSDVLESSLIEFRYDTEMKVTAVSTDMKTINLMKAEIIKTVNNVLLELEYKDIGIPLGNVVASDFLMGIGPKIPVRILAIGETNADFVSIFTSAGINQTKHQIMLEIHAEIDIIFPSGKVTGRVMTEYLVSETVLLGTVPNSYTYINDNESSTLDKLNNYGNDE